MFYGIFFLYLNDSKDSIGKSLHEKITLCRVAGYNMNVWHTKMNSIRVKFFETESCYTV